MEAVEGPTQTAKVPPAARDLTWWCVLLQALVDAPGETRHVVNFKRLTLTDFKLEIPRLASKKVVTEAFSSSGECSTGPHGTSMHNQQAAAGASHGRSR